MTLVQRSTEKLVLNTRLHNSGNKRPAVQTSTENDSIVELFPRRRALYGLEVRQASGFLIRRVLGILRLRERPEFGVQHAGISTGHREPLGTDLSASVQTALESDSQGTNQ